MPLPLLLSSPFGGDTPDGASRYARALALLLPRGVLWNLEQDSWISATLLAIADSLARVDDRAYDLVNEADPSTASETLGDWERVLGLPDDDISAIPATPEERRLAVTQAFVKQGGQTPAYYIALAAACGYTVTIDDQFASDVLRAGFRAGDRVYGLAWAYTWRVNVSPPSGTALSHAELEAVIRRVAPAHTQVIFEYL